MNANFESLTVHPRSAAHRMTRARWILGSGMTALHCGRVLALTRGNTGKIRKVLFLEEPQRVALPFQA
jgi:hypothetical protein